MNIWQEQFPLRFGAVDLSGRLTVAAAMDLFQEAAINHAEALGVGREAMAAAGRAWVLSRMTLVMDRRPRWKDPVTVRSWPRGWLKLFALRDYDIRDRDDRPVVRGRSGWIVVDLEKRRPLRPQIVMEGMPLNEEIDALSEPSPPALEPPANLCQAAERRAAYSDIDYNGHVNNTRYIQWVQDIADPPVLEGAEILRLDVNYLSEVKYGEIIELWTAPLSGSVVNDGNSGSSPVLSIPAYDWAAAFEGRRRDGGGAVFRAELRTGAAPR